MINDSHVTFPYCWVWYSNKSNTNDFLNSLTNDYLWMENAIDHIIQFVPMRTPNSAFEAKEVLKCRFMWEIYVDITWAAWATPGSDVAG